VSRIFLLAFIWGWSFLFIKVGVEGMTPTAVAAGRCGFGMVTLLLLLRLRGVRLPARPLWGHLAFMALVHSAVPFTLLAWSEERITSALAAVLNASTALFTALAAAVLLAERLRRPQLVGLGLGFAGVAVAAGVGGSDLADSSWTGSLAALGAGACYGVGFAYARRHLEGVSPLVASAGQLVAATAMLAPFAVLSTAAEGADLEPHRVLAVVLLGVLGTGYAYVLNYRSIAELGSTRAAVVTYLVPVVAVVVGVLFLDERFELRLLVGGGLIILGIALLHERIRRFRTVPAPA
jgi:drug/metabolite transporter (DMT)-like permease